MMEQFRVDAIINKLWGVWGAPYTLEWAAIVGTFESLIGELCPVARDIFLKEPNLLHLQPPITIAGIQPPLYVDEIDVQDGIKSSSLQILSDCLTSLPVAALISDKIICTHSGLSPRLHDLDQIMHIERCTNLPCSSLLSDLLGTHPRRYGDILVAKEAEFLEKHDLRLVCCGRGHHQAVAKYKDFAEHRVAGFSSTCGRARVYANAVMHVDVNLMCSFHELKGCKRVLLSYHILMAGTNQHECSSRVNLAFRTTTNTYGEDSPFRKESGSGTGGTERDSKSVTKSSGFDFDPASLYRSKFPGVKRFLGAKV